MGLHINPVPFYQTIKNCLTTIHEMFLPKLLNLPKLLKNSLLQFNFPVNLLIFHFFQFENYWTDAISATGNHGLIILHPALENVF
ncbi:MAG: hypothetical protein A4E25_00938 [Methanobacterium sp. PtaB.Bin024]|nr:MAG: hypothetical protein A4E25_00938 [Methanobacterium sp. PtaB.Bin024]